MPHIDTIFAGPMIGELGWSVSRWHAYCRHLKLQRYNKQRFIVADYDWRYPLYEFADEFIPLPKWFLELGLRQDCYEATPKNSPAGSLTPHNVYVALLNYFKQFYDVETTKEIRTPRGCNFVIQQVKTQMWTELVPSKEAREVAERLLYGRRNIIVVSARGRERALQRNIPEAIWEDVVDEFRKRFTVVIIGVPSASLLTNKVGRNIVNVVQRADKGSLDLHIALMKKAMLSISSQSGPTLISLLAKCPSYIIGHESARHSIHENWLKTTCMFRMVPSNIYSAIDPTTIIDDVYKMYSVLEERKRTIDAINKYCMEDSVRILNKIIEENTGIQLLQLDVRELQKRILHELGNNLDVLCWC